MKKRLLMALFVLAATMGATTAYSQYDFAPFSGRTNPGLAAKVRSGRIGQLFVKNTCDGSWEEWSTSYLKPEGKAPRLLPPDSDDGKSQQDYLSWRGMYSAFSAQDKNPKTAWVEGAAGDGIGEMIIAKVDVRKPVKIWSGYGRSSQTFQNNNRPKDVRVYILAGKLDSDHSTECGEMISDVHVTSSSTVTLKDRDAYQPLPLSSKAASSIKGVSLVAVEILSVYKGTKYQDTAISEISN